MAIDGSFFSTAASGLSWALVYGTAVKNPTNNKIEMVLMGFIMECTFFGCNFTGVYILAQIIPNAGKEITVITFQIFFYFFSHYQLKSLNAINHWNRV
jgi:hypothetical protein